MYIVRCYIVKFNMLRGDILYTILTYDPKIVPAGAGIECKSRFYRGDLITKIMLIYSQPPRRP